MPSVPFSTCSTCFTTPSVRSSEEAGGSWTLSMKMPMSSSGTNPAGSALPERPGRQRCQHHHPDGQRIALAGRRLRPVHVCAGRHLEHLVEAAVEGAERPSGRLGRLEDHRAERRRQAQGQERRQQHRDGDGEGELLVQSSGEAAQQRHRHEHGRQNERDRHHRPRHLLHGLDGRIVRRFPMLDVVDHRLDHHDGVVHHDADRQHQAEHGEGVDREAEQREEDEGADQRHRHREQRDDGGAEALQEHEHHEAHQNERLDQGVQDRLDARFDRRAWCRTRSRRPCRSGSTWPAPRGCDRSPPPRRAGWRPAAGRR